MLTESRKLLRITLLLAGASILPGCGSLYLLQAARGQAQIMMARRPIGAVLADPATPPAVRDTLAEVSAARDFASRTLGLPDNRSYRLYADLGRRYVVWNVVAAPEFSVNPRLWCFPVAGCVSYRGYFRQAAAQSYADRLAAQGYDTVVEGVPAYSTLGHFDDPILNTMLPYGRDPLAGIVFHELAHQLLYVPDDSAFNEAFASTVEEEGLARWLAFKGRPDAIEAFRRRQARAGEYSRLLAEARADLARLYASNLPPAPMRAAKQARLAALAASIRETQQRFGVPSGYEEWLSHGLNNADLASVATYENCMPGFRRLLAEQGDLAHFYAAVRALAKQPRARRDAQVCADH
ncbi:MAG TPA: aminopeptidase [Steroidobacteraceae bacterium]|nr:aminopeptidase [Steroidobacteraceae bacterium]